MDYCLSYRVNTAQCRNALTQWKNCKYFKQTRCILERRFRTKLRQKLSNKQGKKTGAFSYRGMSSLGNLADYIAACWLFRQMELVLLELT